MGAPGSGPRKKKATPISRKQGEKAIATTLEAIDLAKPLEGWPLSIDVAEEEIPAIIREAPIRVQQIAILMALGYTDADIAEVALCHPTLIGQLRECYELQRVSYLPKNLKQKVLLSRFDKLAHDALSKITPEKLRGSSAAQLTIMAGIAADKSLKIHESIEAKAGEGADVEALRSRILAAVAPKQIPPKHGDCDSDDTQDVVVSPE